MAIVQIKHKCISIARDYARKNSDARHTGRSIFIKRCYGSYRIIAVEVSASQRSCRDIFAEAQKLASHELKKWNRHRFWSRQAKHHNIKGAHRMAVSYFYRLLKCHSQSADGSLRVVHNPLKPNTSSSMITLLHSPRHASTLRRIPVSHCPSQGCPVVPLSHGPSSPSQILSYYDEIVA